MMVDGVRLQQQQSGAATLLMALVLMMSITIITLAVARTQVSEQKIVANQNWNTRLFLAAEAGMVRGIAYLTRSIEDIAWTQAADHVTLIKRVPLKSSHPDIRTDVVFSHPQDSNTYLSVHATARRDDASGVQADIVQYVRPLSILTPLAETLPPLVINGCLASLPLSVHIRPLHADTDQAGAAVWLNRDIACPVPESVDIHSGSVGAIDMADGLWQRIFSVTQEQFKALAAQQQGLPPGERRYRVAQASDLRAGRWIRSLGSAATPVTLFFEAGLGCPEFSPGVHIHGIVFIDADCPEPLASHGFELFGSMIVNGNLDIRNAALQLNHIQLADSLQTRLRFPVLRNVPVPGSWRDF